jgi:2-oxoglutarate ferredoxin oxidoreductase subunit alpha
MRAFSLAERFRTPVFLATDKEIVLTMTTVDVEDYAQVPVEERRTAPADASFIPYGFERPEDVPAFSPFGGPHLVRFTTSTHDEHGFMTKDPEKVGRLNTHLAAKIEAHREELEMVVADLEPGAETLIISYGITARSVAEAVREARQRGQHLSALKVQSLWPVPERAITAAMASHRRVVVAELNHGQYRREIERLAAGRCEVVGAHRVDGQLLSPEEILELV